MIRRREFSFRLIAAVLIMVLSKRMMNRLVQPRVSHFLAVSAFSPLFKKQATTVHDRGISKICRYSSSTAREESLNYKDTVASSLSLQNVPLEMKRAFCEDILPLISDLQSNMTTVLLAGISGGCDSIALFHSLQHVRDKENTILGSDVPWSWTLFVKHNVSVTFRLHAIHFDHQQRGESSNADRELVEELCQQYHVPCQSIQWDNDYSIDDFHFSQEKARNWRRSHMRRHLRQLVNDAKTKSTTDASSDVTGVMLSAHHLDDSNETLLLKLIRGSHLTKLTGMKVLAADEIDADLYWARPMLALRKNQLTDFLQENEYLWREDESNQKDTYLRNRVRNELVPLMKDLMGGDTAFQKRLDSMEAQSQKLRMDVSQRADSYLHEHTSEDAACSSRTVFSIPKDIAKCNLVFEEAFHVWVSGQAVSPNDHSDYQFTFEHFQRLVRQITDYPRRRKWSLNIGGGWDIQREGDILRILESDSVSGTLKRQNASHPLEALPALPATLESSCSYIQIRLSFAGRHVFTSSRGCDYKSLKITPPWRKGRSPLKLKDFLRGQKVTLHDRGDLPIILTHGESEDAAQELVAVFVDTKGKWILDAKFCSNILSDDRDESAGNIWLRIPKWMETRKQS